MADEVEFPLDIPGASRLVAWFGCWPTFHDAEVLSICLDRLGTSHVRVHTFETTEQLDSKGYYVTRKHAIVRFRLGGVRDLRLTGFNRQNVISELTITRISTGYSMELGPCYGIGGLIEAASIEIEFESGMPPGSVYGG